MLPWSPKSWNSHTTGLRIVLWDELTISLSPQRFNGFSLCHNDHIKQSGTRFQTPGYWENMQPKICGRYIGKKGPDHNHNSCVNLDLGKQWLYCFQLFFSCGEDQRKIKRRKKVLGNFCSCYQLSPQI